MNSIAVKPTAFREAGFSMVLPGTWARIPLRDEKRAAEVVASLVTDRVGRDDRFATVRRNARQELTDIVVRAREAGALQLALSMELLPGVPFPASAMFTVRQWPAGPPAEHGTLDALRAMLPGAEAVDSDAGATVRVWRQVRIRPGTETIQDTKIEYLVAIPDGLRVLHVAADAPVDTDPELIVALFDAMVDSIRWHEAAAAAAG